MKLSSKRKTHEPILPSDPSYIPSPTHGEETKRLHYNLNGCKKYSPEVRSKTKIIL